MRGRISLTVVVLLLASSLSWAATEPNIRVKLKNGRIDTLPLEEYLKGTLAGEMPHGWPIETLKAQAVAARTYAYYIIDEKRKNGSTSKYDLRSGIEDQVYKKSGSYGPNVVKAVAETTGQVITYHNKPILARFHSSCGGKTETSIHVWGENDVSKSIKDPYCKDSPYNNWELTLTSSEITDRLKKHGFDPGEIKLIKPERFEESGRTAAVAIHGSKQTISLTGNDFRRYIGFGKIKSTSFNVYKHGYKFTFTGRGFGHGVGMCQWGAKGMAEAGNNYLQILGFYYPGTKITQLYEK